MVTILVKASHGKLVLLPTRIFAPVDPAIYNSTCRTIDSYLLTSLLPHDGVTSSVTENSETINSHEPASENQKIHLRYNPRFYPG